VTHLLIIGGSDAGISAALRAKELAPSTEITILLSDNFPNFSICGLPFFLSGEVSDWRNLAHRLTVRVIGPSKGTSVTARLAKMVCLSNGKESHCDH